MIVAFIELDHTALGGPIRATNTGWKWHLLAAVRDTTTNRKEILSGYDADTLDADDLTVTKDKIIAATKAAVITAGFATLNTAVVPSRQIFTGL